MSICGNVWRMSKKSNCQADVDADVCQVGLVYLGHIAKLELFGALGMDRELAVFTEYCQ